MPTYFMIYTYHKGFLQITDNNSVKYAWHNKCFYGTYKYLIT